MTDLERAKRIEAWTWAAETLGIAVTSERLNGLVDVSARIHVENLKPALAEVMRTQPSGFLPVLSAVHAASHRLAGERRERLQKELYDKRVAQFQIEANASPASAEDVQTLRDRIEWLANRAQRGYIKKGTELPKGIIDRGTE